MPEVAPGIHRVGSELVNSWLVEVGSDIVMVHAGLPRYWSEMLAELESMGRSVDDVRALVLTHGHGDHVGYAERARRAGIPARVHELDASLARGEVKNEAKRTGPTRLGPILGFLAFAALRGYATVPKLKVVTSFADGDTLDVPGAPRVIHAPGHTHGSSALHFAGLDALFVGDSLNTYAVTSGRRGPQLSPFNYDRAQALASLDRLAEVASRHVLPGHGAAWSDGVAAAVELARAAG